MSEPREFQNKPSDFILGVCHCLHLLQPLTGPLGYGSTHVPAVGSEGRYQAAELRPNTERPTLIFRKSVNFQSIQLGRLDAHLKGDFPGGPVVRTLLPLQGAQVRSLVRRLKIPHTIRQTAHPAPALQRNALKKKKI